MNKFMEEYSFMNNKPDMFYEIKQLFSFDMIYLQLIGQDKEVT